MALRMWWFRSPHLAVCARSTVHARCAWGLSPIRWPPASERRNLSQDHGAVPTCEQGRDRSGRHPAFVTLKRYESRPTIWSSCRLVSVSLVLRHPDPPHLLGHTRLARNCERAPGASDAADQRSGPGRRSGALRGSLESIGPAPAPQGHLDRDLGWVRRARAGDSPARPHNSGDRGRCRPHSSGRRSDVRAGGSWLRWLTPGCAPAGSRLRHPARREDRTAL